MRLSFRPLLASLSFALSFSAAAAERPNIVFLFSDDHALEAISAYGGSLAEIAPTPHIDQLAKEGALFTRSFCANSICGPSRATILTGKHSHANGFLGNGVKGGFDQSQWTLPKTLQGAGYETAVIGKWHLGSEPVGFDHWDILPGQGNYYNPVFIGPGQKKTQVEGYCTDIITDKAEAWLEAHASADKPSPFLLMCQHKAPHRTFSPPLRHLDLFDGVTIPEPATLFDSYDGDRSKTLATNTMEIDRHMDWAYDLKVRMDERGDIKLPKPDRYPTVEYNRMNDAQKEKWNAHYGPENKAFLERFAKGDMPHKELVRWKHQRYVKNYLATVRAVDDGVGRVVQKLKELGLSDNTIVIYSSDQGFFLGEHGWYDKRWMFEESLAMPFIIRWPGVVEPGSRPDAMIQNVDYAPTFLDAAGVEIPEELHGHSLVPVLRGDANKVRDSLYYAYYEHNGHGVPRHFGVRTETHKLIHFPTTNEWNLIDLIRDPQEMKSQHANPEYAGIRKELEAEYHRLREKFDAPAHK